MNLTPRKKNLEEHFDYLAEGRNKWIKKNEYYYKQEEVYTRFLISKGKRVLELGCGTGSLLNSLSPSYGVGVDLSEKNILIAQEDYPNLEFIHADMEDANFLSKLDGKVDKEETRWIKLIEESFYNEI
jgi:ubiquinone/menaquinone biosynthesis C-methylase UbiE